MRSSTPGIFRLAFLLPAEYRVSYAGPQPSGTGCFLRVTQHLVEVTGPSRLAVFDRAAELLRAILAMVQLPLSITAVLESPSPVSGRDSFSIIIGADVAFSPTSIDPYFPRVATA